MQSKPIPAGRCQCGCGLPVQRRYAQGHNKRGDRSLRLADRHIVENHGYNTLCWTSTMARGYTGYAYVSDGGRLRLAHRVAYEQAHGPIPDGLQIDHLCRNPACVNPDHLEVVTAAENMRRRPATKLTFEQACEIKRLLRTEKQTHIAAMFGVSQGCISSIVAGNSWKDAHG